MSTFAYVTNNGSDTITKVALDGSKVVGRPLGVGYGPNSIAIDPAGKFAYVAIGGLNSNSIRKINLSTFMPVGATIRVGQGARAFAVDPVGEFAYTANYISKSVTKIRLSPFSTVLSFNIDANPGPVSLAINSSGNYAYVVSATPSVTKINLVTSSVVGSLALSAGGGTQYDIAIDLSETFAYVTNLQGGIVTKINLSTFKVAATLTVETPHSIAIDPSNTYAYVTNYATGTLTKIDLSTFNLVGLPLECGDGCAGVAIASSGNIYVVNSTDGIDGTVTEIDRETFTTVGMARTVGSNPQRIAIDPLPALSTSKAGSN